MIDGESSGSLKVIFFDYVSNALSFPLSEKLLREKGAFVMFSIFHSFFSMEASQIPFSSTQVEGAKIILKYLHV